MLPLVSVIIPLYNAEQYIAETIQNVLNQTYRNVEILVIDDGSTDNGLAIAREYESEKVKIFSQPNSGASAARNIGLQESKGDFIQFLDADDLLSANKIEAQVELLKEDKYKIAYCTTLHFYEDEKIPDFEISEEKIGSDLENPVHFLINLYGGYDKDASMVTIHSWLTPRLLITNAGYWNESLTVDDDGEYFCRVLLQARNIVFTNNTACYYRKYKKNISVSSVKGKKSFESMFLSTSIKEENLLAANNSLNTKKGLAQQYLEIAVSSYPAFKDISKKAEQKSISLGGSKKQYYTHTLFYRITTKLLGWKFSAQISYLKQKLIG